MHRASRPLIGGRVSLPVYLLLLGMSASCGCSSHVARLQSPRRSFYNNDLQAAQRSLKKLSEKPKHDESVVELDLAMVELLDGNINAAENRLRSVRDEWDRLEQSSLVESAASYVTDDQTRAYAGEDYEKILVRVLLTLCSLLQDEVDAESYSLQTLAKQQDLMESARRRWNDELEENYCIPAVAPYLRGVLRESTHSNYDDAARSYHHAQQLAPELESLKEDIARAEQGTHSQPGNGVLYVIAFVGRGPYKVETEARATQEALLVADRLLSAVGEYSIPPTLAPVKVPAIASPPMPFQCIGVEVGGLPVATTATITDIDLLARNTFAERLPDIMARTVARRIIKKGAVYAAKDQFNANSDLASLAFDAAGVLWEATESADTRCWGLLPREIQVLRIELPKGEHTIGLEPVTAGRPVAAAQSMQIPIVDGRNTYLLSFWPESEPVGQMLLQSRP